MDPHVRKMAKVLEAASVEVDGELYESVTYDDAGRACEITPALKADLGGRLVNIMLFDVPGDKDHFSIVLNATPRFTLMLREEVRWDWVLKSLGRVEDHIIGLPDFDRKYLIGGQPADAVIRYLKRPDIQKWIGSLGDFLNLAADSGFMRATFPLNPKSAYTVDELRSRVVSLMRLAEVAEGKEPATA